MAEIALGKNCPICGTLAAPSGRRIDENLAGQCGLGHTVSMPNPHYVARHTVPLTNIFPHDPEPVLIPAPVAPVVAPTPVAAPKAKA